jgi:hypothetical protein
LSPGSGDITTRPTTLAGPITCFVALVTAFLAVAASSDYFIDRPFTYVGPSEWVQNLVHSTARFPGPAESGLLFGTLMFLTPAILILAHALAGRDAWDPSRLVPSDEVRMRRLAFGFAALAVALSAACRLFITRGIPLVDDERSYLFQAGLFASGQNALPAPPDALRNPMFLLRPAWFSKYPPGQALVLLPGVLMKVPGLPPLVIVALLTLGVFLFVRNEYGHRLALGAAGLMALCPCMIVCSATAVSLPTMACAGLWCLTAMSQADRTGRTRWNVLAGACLGFALLTRPLDAFAFALPTALTFARAIERRETPRPGAALGAFAGGFVPVAALLPLWNWRMLGAPWRLGYAEAHDYAFGFGVHPVAGVSYVHTPMQAVGNLMVGLLRLDLWLLGWPLSLLLVLVGLRSDVTGRLDRMIRLVVPAHILLGLLLATSGVPDIGPAYLIPIAPLLIVMGARGLQVIVRSADLGGRIRRMAVWTCALGCMTGWLVIMPLRLVRLHALTSEMTVPWRTVAQSGIGDAVVVVPFGSAMGAAGYNLGYPYEVPTGPHTRANLCRPRDVHELDAARAFLGPTLPVYRLQLDVDSLERQGVRRYALLKMPDHAAP